MTEWFPKHDWVRDPKTKKVIEVISENVIGRFITHPVLDGPASSAAKKNIYKDGVLLLTKSRADVMGRQSHDVSTYVVNADKDPDGVEAVLKSFPEAWESFSSKSEPDPKPTKRKKASK